MRAAGIKRAQTLVEAAQISVGWGTVIGFVAEAGNIRRFTDPKQIKKLAGLEIVKKSSGKKKGQSRIRKRGRRKLRRTMYESARALINWNPAFQDAFLYYRNRERNPFGGMQAKIAVACKAIRIFYIVLQTGYEFDEKRFRRDIVYKACPRVGAEAAPHYGQAGRKNLRFAGNGRKILLDMRG